jgi:hypothetical protein
MRQLGLAHMYQYGDTGKFYGDMPLPIDEHDTLIHVGGNANGIKTYGNDKGMISMSSNLRGLQAGLVSIIESNVEWQEYEWRENTNQMLRKTFGDARVDYSTSKTKFEGRYKPDGTVAQTDPKTDWPTHSLKFTLQCQQSLWKQGSVHKDGDMKWT